MKIKLLLAVLLTAFTSYFAQTGNFRFAWMSDLHVGSATGEKDLRRSVEDINKLDSISFTIISGDITQTGKGSDLRLAKSILDALKKPYYIIPGNHDTKWSESGATDFIKLWGHDRFTFRYSGILFIGMHEGPLMRMADGHFAPEDLRWLDSTLAKVDKTEPVFIVTHYPVEDEIDNWYELIDRIKPFNVEVILVGHGHANRKLNFEGIKGIMGRSNLRAGKPVGGYNLVQVEDGSMHFSERIPGVKTLPEWNRITLEKVNYLADTTKYKRPDFSINKLNPNVNVKWRKETGYTITSAPAVYKNMAVVGNTSGNVYAFSLKDGSKVWSYKTGSAVLSSAEISGEKVVLASADSNIYCLNLKNGKFLWKYKTNAAVVAVPVVSDGTVYIGSSDNTFRALSLGTGKLRWAFNGLEGFVEAKPLVYQDKVIFGAWDSYLYALDKKSGKLLWKWNNGNEEVLYSPSACYPVASMGKVFIVAPDRYMTALDANTGKVVWRTNRFKVRESIGISQDGKSIYARCMTDTVIAVPAKENSFKTFWARDVKYGYDIDPNMPEEKQGQVFFGTKNGFVYALDNKTGKTLWTYRTGEALVNNLAVIDKNNVIVTTMDGSVLRITIKN
ncbi:MAG TPA: PQQ-binding-like beta-propeller repeat protein [Ignavibacteriales bacterium]|nr:PQQ-binding-like beta-propeller repeat protein [Ignavibacteriales bacterium]